MNLPDYDQFGGVHSEFAALKNVLAYQGVVNPVTGEALSEALLFGIGAGVGASYFNFVYEGYPPGLSINMVGRYKAKYGEVMRRTCERLGLTATLKLTKSENAAVNHLKKALAKGQPVIVQVISSFGDVQLQGYEIFAEQALVVYGLDETADVVQLGSQSAQPLSLPLHQLTALRHKYAPLKNLSLTVMAGEVDVVQGVEVGLQTCVEAMLKPPTPKGNFGLNALQKWADLVVDTKGKKGWLNVFTPGTYLYDALAGTFAQIELVGANGGGLRGLYADFLMAAGQILGKPALAEVAEVYGQVAAQWTAVAEAALPERVAIFEESKALMRRKQAAFLAGETAVLPEINHRQTEIHEGMADGFPLAETACLELLQGLQAEILTLYEMEKNGVEMLQAMI